MADVLKKVPVREQEPKVRATNFEEVCYGYNKEEAMEEATRCLNCKNARCIQGCPVSINIPAFIAQIKDGNIEEAYKVIGQSSALPAICGRVCPQESQCESKCVRGIKGDAVSIGKLERFVADYALENDIKPEKPEKTEVWLPWYIPRILAVLSYISPFPSGLLEFLNTCFLLFPMFQMPMLVPDFLYPVEFFLIGQ